MDYLDVFLSKLSVIVEMVKKFNKDESIIIESINIFDIEVVGLNFVIEVVEDKVVQGVEDIVSVYVKVVFCF